MMCASSHNSKPLGPVWAQAQALVVTLVLTLAVVLWLAAPASAASRGSDPPRTGLEGGARHNFGPDGESRMEKRFMTGGAGVDAYGNPIVMGEEEPAAPRTRPRPGAYGTRPDPEPVKPLPDLPPEPSKWKF